MKLHFFRKIILFRSELLPYFTKQPPPPPPWFAFGLRRASLTLDWLETLFDVMGGFGGEGSSRMDSDFDENNGLFTKDSSAAKVISLLSSKE